MGKMAMITAAVAGLAVTLSASAGEVEVLHDWASSGHTKSATERKMVMQPEGHTWYDRTMASDAGSSAMTLFKSCVLSGDPPAAARIEDPAIQGWATEGTIENVINQFWNDGRVSVADAMRKIVLAAKT